MEVTTPAIHPVTAPQVNHRFVRVAPLLAIVLFVVAIQWHFILKGEALYWGDMLLYFYPLEHVVKTSLANGRLPLWNPYIYCGQPLLGNPQSWVFYPGTIFLAFMPVWMFFTLNNVIHLLASGLGAYLYLRRLCGDRSGALLGAFCYAGSGFIIARLQFPTMIQSAAYLPWILLLVDRIIERPRIWYASFLAAVVGLELLAAHAQIAYMSLACSVFYALVRLFQIRKHFSRMLRALCEMTGALLLGLMVSAVQILPTLQLFGESTREHLKWKEANRFVLLPKQLINFIFPNYFGSPATGDYWGPGNKWEAQVFLGLIPLGLAIYGAARAPRRRAVWFYLVIGVITLLLSMGRFGGLYWIAYYVVPGVASFHDPARFVMLTTFSICVLAAIGLRRLRDGGISERARIVLVALSGINLAMYSASFNPSVPAKTLAYRARALAEIPTSGAGRVYTSHREEVWQRFVNYADYGPNSQKYVHELTDTITPNIGMGFGVEEASGYEPVPLKAMTELDILVQAAVDRHSSRLPILMKLFGADTLLLPQETRYLHPAFQRSVARGMGLYRTEGSPRLWLVAKTVRVDGSQRSLAAISSPEFDPSIEAIVSGSSGLANETALSGGRQIGYVKAAERRPGLLRVEVDCGGTPQFLVRSAAYYPGWAAAIDGVPVAVERTNHAFQGLVVPPGKHSVEFEYKPFVFRLGLFLSLVAGSIISAGLGMGVVLRKRAEWHRTTGI